MHFYAQSRDEVLKLPLKTFWLMNTNIDRLKAENDQRSMSLSMVVASQDKEVIGEFRKSLVIEAGSIVKSKEIHVRDEEGFAELKAM